MCVRVCVCVCVRACVCVCVCDWLRARCLVAVSSQILEKRLRCTASSGDSALFITWYSFYNSEDGRETVLSF